VLKLRALGLPKALPFESQLLPLIYFVNQENVDYCKISCCLGLNGFLKIRRLFLLYNVKMPTGHVGKKYIG
jgi:hypothetical protein